MKLLLLSFICTVSISAGAQYAIGHTTITFNDPSRTGGTGSGGGPGRQIQTEIYYPGVSTGDNVTAVNGEFPVIVFGHGFAMSWDAYKNVWEALVAEGYVLAFPRTEGGLLPAPSHAEFGTDLALVVTKMVGLNTTSGSVFENKINGNAGIMGHSMGGGATFLAAANNTVIKTAVGLAPAETTPSAIAAAANVSVPVLIMSGSSDGVAAPATNHLPIYDAVTGTCKYYMSITGGAHCYFANSNFNCDFGETTSSTGITIQRAAQQQVMKDYLIPWFDFYLKDECAAWNRFKDPQATDNRIVPTNTCSVSVPSTPVISLGNQELVSSNASNNQWYLNGTILPGETNVTCPLTRGEGNYTVANTAEVDCQVMSLPYNYTTASVSEVSKMNYLLYPNPVDNQLNLKLSDDLPFQLYIHSIDGKLIFETAEAGTVSLDVSAWREGIYLVTISQNGSETTQRILKQ